MTDKKSLRASISGIGSSLLPVLGICGGGACAAACGIAIVTPLASILGVSSAALSAWTAKLLPVFIAISAVSFTVAYYSLYNKKAACNPDSCDTSCDSSPKAGENRWAKPVFWIGLLLTLAFYGKAIASSSQVSSEMENTPAAKSSCEIKSSEAPECSEKKKC